MKSVTARIAGTPSGSVGQLFCDAWLVDGRRVGADVPGLSPECVLGRWPDELETDAAVRLAQVLGSDATWEALAATPPVAQKLAERARPQRLDLEIGRHLQHLQHVCHRPRLNLRVEEERVPVSRARRIPVRAVADLVSHPGDWEHRTLRSIQPSRVLARQIEDEWNLYENRVAVRLVDHLLGYLARRLEELRKIKEILKATRDHSDEVRGTSFRRARRIAELWSETLESKTEEELDLTMERLQLAQRDLQALLDAPLYQRVPQRLVVPVALQPTNILVNDPHYRKVAALWRAWVKFGHRRQESAEQRSARRQREGAAWDRFVLHLVVRAFTALGWTVARDGYAVWRLSKPGWSSVVVEVGGTGVVTVTSAGTLRLLPLCANLGGADPQAAATRIGALDGEDDELVVAHVGAPLLLSDVDRATGWSFGARAVLLGCSPWGIDSEERMTRVIHGWLSRRAIRAYPAAKAIRDLPTMSRKPQWLRHAGNDVVAFRGPTPAEASEAQAWATGKAKELEAAAARAKAAKQAFAIAPREAIRAFQAFVEEATEQLAGLDRCPVCDGDGVIEPRPGKKTDGSDATWWARCSACDSEWGTRPCTGCGARYRALVPQAGLDPARPMMETPPLEWPDRVLGRDTWAQPCSGGVAGQFRCPDCGACSAGGCARCRERGGSR